MKSNKRVTILDYNSRLACHMRFRESIHTPAPQGIHMWYFLLKERTIYARKSEKCFEQYQNSRTFFFLFWVVVHLFCTRKRTLSMLTTCTCFSSFRLQALERGKPGVNRKSRIKLNIIIKLLTQLRGLQFILLLRPCL